MSQNITMLPATPQDRMNYLLGLCSAVQQIGITIKFQDQLSEDLVEQSIQLAAVQNPVLSGRFVEVDTPYWEIRDDGILDEVLSVQYCMQQEMDSLIESYMAQPINWISGPLLEARIFRTQHDTLCLKMSHLCGDGTGLKQLTKLIASLYTRLAQQEDYASLQQLLLAEQPGVRDQAALFAATGITDLSTVIREPSGSASLWSFPVDSIDNAVAAVVRAELEPEQMQELKTRIRAHNATINDALLAAYFRSLSKRAVYMEPQTKEKAVGMTVDLRKYLPNRATEFVCNMSGMEMPQIELDHNDSFESTLIKVKLVMDQLKADHLGLSSAAGMERMAELPLSAAVDQIGKQQEMAKQMRMALPMMTNFGTIDEAAVQFDTCEASEAYMTSPLMYAPFFSVGASSFRNTLTLSVGFHTPALAIDSVKNLLDDMINELTF
ncbi:condensation domain-containing protein [Neobacillus mesonae]|nr:condensation domain-containing protein [Neobacillus mesonae]